MSEEHTATAALQERSEIITCGPAEALAGLLNTPLPDLDRGLPPLWHWVYLLSRPAQSILGPDGHPARGEIPSPPGPGRLRMFAGGCVRITGLLRPGRVATRQSRVIASQDKQGRTGSLTFVTVAHDIVQDDTIVIAEEQNIVYRDAASARRTPHPTTDVGRAAAPTVAVSPTEEESEFVVDPVVLFRFSALTYNAHRIHYDRDYAINVEGYPGLVVHGPLQALLMAEHASRRSPEEGLISFDYRLMAPLFDHQGLVVGATADIDRSMRTWTRDLAGRETARGVWRRAA